MWLVALAARITDALARLWARSTRYDRQVAGGITGASAELIAALHRARLLVSEHDNDRPAMITGSNAAGSREPWNRHVAYTVLGVQEAARRLEAATRLQVAGTVIARGCSDTSTDAAIEALDALTAAVPSKQAQDITRQLAGWTTSLLRLPAIDEAVIWLPIRSQTLCGECGSLLSDGVCPLCGWQSRPPRCPYCSTMHLRRADRAFVVMCFYPGCHDRDGNCPPFARLDVSSVTGGAILAWSDGLVEGA